MSLTVPRLVVMALCGLLLAVVIAQTAFGGLYRFGPALLKIPDIYLADYDPPAVPGGPTAVALHVTLNDPAAPGGDFTVLALLTYKAGLATDQPLLNLLKKYIDRGKPPVMEGRYTGYDLTDSHSGDTLYLANAGAYPEFFICRHPFGTRDRDWPMSCEVVESLGSGEGSKMPDGKSLVVLDYFLPKTESRQIPEIDARLRALIAGFEQPGPREF